MKIYLSSRFGRAAELREYREELTAMGHVVIASWLDESPTNDSLSDPAALVRFAEQDIADMRRCEAIIAFTEESNSPFARGGRHVEFGVMLERRHIASLIPASPIDLWVVGPCENVFHSLPFVTRVDSWVEFIQAFKVMR